MATFARNQVDGPWAGQDIDSYIQRMSRRNMGTTRRAGLNDQNCVAQRRHDAVPLRKLMRCRSHGRFEFGQYYATRPQLSVQWTIQLRVFEIQPRSKDGQRLTARGEGTTVRR